MPMAMAEVGPAALLTPGPPQQHNTLGASLEAAHPEATNGLMKSRTDFYLWVNFAGFIVTEKLRSPGVYQSLL